MISLRRLRIGTRLLLTTLVLVLLTLPLAGWLLAWNFNQSVTAAFDERLDSLATTLLANVDYNGPEDELLVERASVDARFNRVFSGWYWQLTDRDGRELVSRSLWDERLPVSDSPSVLRDDVEGPRGQPLRRLQKRISLPGMSEELYLTLAASRAELNAEVERFGRLLWLSLLIIGILLVMGLALQLRWGLAPLRRLHTSLHRVEQGEQDQLPEDLPVELNELSVAMNSVLERDRQLIERGRVAAGNLAHALKTPVSVLKTLAEQLPEADRAAFEEHLERIDGAVSHHLARASAAGSGSLQGRTRLQETLQPVFVAIQRLSERRHLEFDFPLASPVALKVDPQDLQELVGNLLENAMQWARSRLRLSVEQAADHVVLQVDDDGPGMSHSECEQMLARGARLDRYAPGSGLGLAIVQELVNLYGGQLHLGPSPLGGLRVAVSLPVQ